MKIKLTIAIIISLLVGATVALLIQNISLKAEQPIFGGVELVELTFDPSPENRVLWIIELSARTHKLETDQAKNNLKMNNILKKL